MVFNIFWVLDSAIKSKVSSKRNSLEMAVFLNEKGLGGNKWNLKYVPNISEPKNLFSVAVCRTDIFD